MFHIHRSVDIDFAHHVRGHDGPCANVHGHTWKFEVGARAETLDPTGFVVDFHALIDGVLEPCRSLLDHALAVGEETYAQSADQLAALGSQLVPGAAQRQAPAQELGGARAHYPGGMKVVVFPFNPTSERLAAWLYHVADKRLSDARVRVSYGRVYETLAPVESVAEYRP